MQSITRRTFVAMTATGAVAAPMMFAYPSKGYLSVEAVINRVMSKLGEGQAEVVNRLKAGDVATRVTGIATTALASLAVLQASVRAGANLILTCEPTFYSKADTPVPSVRPDTVPTPDPVSEEPGMKRFAEWLKTIVPEVPSLALSAGDPYWKPTA